MIKNKLLFYVLVIMSMLFFIVSVLSWNLYLSSCAFILAITATRFMEDSGISYFRKKSKNKK